MLAICGGGLRTGSTVVWQTMCDILINHAGGEAPNLKQNISYWAAEWAAKPHWVVHKFHPCHPVLDDHLDRLKAVLTVRDPRDVMVSLTHFSNRTVEEVWERGDATINMRRYYEWVSRVPEDRILVIRYEDRRGFPYAWTDQIARFFGIVFREDEIFNIVERWSVERNQDRVGNQYEYGDYRYMSSRHIRDGSSQQWRDALTEDQVYRVEKAHAAWMDELGYKRVCYVD